MKRKMILSVLLIFLGIVAFGSYSQAKGKTYRISAKTKPCDPEYIYGGAYNKNTKHYFLIRSYLEKLQKTGGTLLLKKGTYHICSTLYVPSNVTIRLAAKTKIKKTIKSGTTRRKPTKYLFLLTRESKAKKSDTAKYKSSRNVSFIGGSGSVIDMGFTKEAIGIGMAHNYNVSIKKIQFKNRYGGNYIAAAGAKKVSIDQCKFYAGKDLLNEESKYDIRLEVANKEIDTLGFSWSKLDNTTNDNILIQNNLFSGMYGAIGTTKHAHPVVGKKKKPKIFYQKNIRIKNNKFLNITGTAVKGMAWNGFTASGNSFYLNKSGKVNTPYGIHLYGAKQPVIQKNRASENKD